MAGRVVRSDGDVVDALTEEMQRLVREGLRLAGILVAVLVGYWLLGLAAAFFLLLLLVALFAGPAFDGGAGLVLIAAAVLAAVACFGGAARDRRASAPTRLGTRCRRTSISACRSSGPGGCSCGSPRWPSPVGTWR